MTDSEGKRADKIGAYAEQGNVYVNTLIVEQAEERAKLAGIPQNVPLRGATKFVGREDDLRIIREQLQKCDRVIISAIAGMGGVGKTELAIRYAVLFADDFAGGICWLNGKNPDLVGQLLDFVRSHLSLTIPPALKEQLLTSDQQFEWFVQHWMPKGSILMVLDDVSAELNLAAFVQKLPLRFRVLLTTRVKGLDAGFFEWSLDVLPPDQSLKLLSDLIGVERTQREAEAAESLCVAVGQLPLGLELVGRFLAKKPFLSLSEMQKQLHLKHEALDRRDAKYVMTAQQGVRAAFELSWEELDEWGMELGRVVSLFAADAIPWGLVQSMTEALGWASEQMETAREQLYSRHLLQTIDPMSFRLHPLIQEFLSMKREESDGAEGLRTTYIQVLVEVAGEIPFAITLAQVAQFAPAIPHLKELAQSDLQFVPDEKIGGLFEGLSRFYEGQGAYAVAEPWRNEGVRLVRDRLGEDHPSYLAVLHNLAGLYDSQGRYGEAEPLYLQVRDIQKQVLGEDHPNYLNTLHNLAGLYVSQANFAKFPKATLLYIQVVKAQIKILGWRHPNTRDCIFNLVGILFLEVALALALINFALSFLHTRNLEALLRFVVYILLFWLLMRETVSERLWKFLRRKLLTRRNRQQ